MNGPLAAVLQTRQFAMGWNYFFVFTRKTFPIFKITYLAFFLVMDLENSQLNHKCTKRHSTTKMGIRKHFHESSMSKNIYLGVHSKVWNKQRG